MTGRGFMLNDDLSPREWQRRRGLEAAGGAGALRAALGVAGGGLSDDMPMADWQDEPGRLWDIMTMLRHAIRTAGSTSEIQFVVCVQNDKSLPKPVTLKAVCGPGDTLEPCITVMTPTED